MEFLIANRHMERFLSKVVIPFEQDRCWEWQTATTHDGYGRFKVNRKTVTAHRWLYQQITGKQLSNDIFVCHKCDNPACVNPLHLFQGSHQENVNDMLNKGRGRRARGMSHGGATLPDFVLTEIRELCQSGRYTQRDIGKKYGVSRETINNIYKRRGRFAMSIKNQYQQGDVLIEQIQEIPRDAAPVKGVVLAEGEGTHVHRAATTEGVQLFVKDGITFARVSKETTIEHVMPDGRKGEHNPVTVPPGDYRYSQVQEYDYLLEMARSVID